MLLAVAHMAVVRREVLEDLAVAECAHPLLLQPRAVLRAVPRVLLQRGFVLELLVVADRADRGGCGWHRSWSGWNWW